VAERIARAWFQCPDSGDEVIVEVYAARAPSRCRPTSYTGGPEGADTERWCELFNGTQTVGMGDTVATLRSFGVGRSDLSEWEYDR